MINSSRMLTSPYPRVSLGGGGGGGSSGLDYDEIDYSYNNALETGEVYKKASSTVKTVSISYDSSLRPETISDGTHTWTLSYNGIGELITAVKT